MEKQTGIPAILRAQIALTFLTGAGIGTVAAIVFTVSKDLTLFILGSILFLWCLLKGWILRSCIQTGHYKCVTGICTSISQFPFRRYKKVRLTLANGDDIILLLGLQTKIKAGTWYRFYFRSDSVSGLSNEYLDAALSTNIFLGYKECTDEPDTLQ